MEKCALEVDAPKVKEDFGMEHLCARMKGGVQGSIHYITFMLQQHAQYKKWGFLFIDRGNMFNEENQTDMLWVVWYEFPTLL